MLAVGTGMAGGVMSAGDVERLHDDRVTAAQGVARRRRVTASGSAPPRR